MVLFLAVSLFGSLTIAPATAQDEVPAGEQVVAAETSADETSVTDQPPAGAPAAEPAQQAPAPVPVGALEIRLIDANGVGLSGLFAVTDAAGASYEKWTEGGVVWFPELVAGTATISQRGGTTDYGFDGATPTYIDVPAGGQAVQPVVNAFLDIDVDGVGDSVDICGAGNDAVDADADGVPDACDPTPNGDTDGDGIDALTDPTPNGDDDGDGVDNAADACPEGDDAVDTDADGRADACDEATGGETPGPPGTPDAPATPDASQTSTVVAGVAPEPVTVEGARVTCDQLAGLTPTIASDLAAYAPGAVVILTGAGWAPGQVVRIDIDDDGAVDAAGGAWSLAATMTAGHSGGFSYQLTLPDQVAATYRVVATGECAAAEETSEIVAAVAAEPEVVKDAPVTCTQADAVAPWIVTDLADYPPGARVTLTGGNWVAGQTIEILVEDDGIADAEYGPWSHTATVTADAQGEFTYQFDLAPWYVADYSVVATGECREARTTFTDSLTVVTATVNGGQSTIVGQGSTISATVTVSRIAGDNWRRTDWNIGGLISGCVNHADFSGAGTNTVTFNITAPNSTGTFDVTFRAFPNDNCTAQPVSKTLSQAVTVGANNTSASSTVSPNGVQGGASQQFTVRINNHSTIWELCSAKIQIPAAFGVSQPLSVTFSGSGFKGGNNGWIYTFSTTGNDAYKIVMKAAGGDGCINLNSNQNTNGHISATFTAVAPSTAGTYPFTAEAWKSTDHNSDKYTMHSSGAVTVTAPATFSAAATITPTTVQASTSQQYTVSVTNNGTGGALLGSAKILIPTGFTAPPSVTFSGSAGVTGWTATIGGDGKVWLNADTTANRIGANAWVEATFTITSPATGDPRTFTVEAWDGIAFAGNTFGVASQPTVNVTAACTPVASASGSTLNFADSTWNGTAYPTVDGTLDIQISATGANCSGLPSSWRVTASTSDMIRDGGGGTIPADAISFTGVISGPTPNGLSASTAKQLNGSPQRIASGGATTSTGTATATFELSPPPTAPPGTYRGTITISADTSSG